MVKKMKMNVKKTEKEMQLMLCKGTPPFHSLPVVPHRIKGYSGIRVRRCVGGAIFEAFQRASGGIYEGSRDFLLTPKIVIENVYDSF